ncbi:carboxymuconolactone decarboxylase family protein [Rhodococcus sp. 114MFTsu3.1]|uniref:carboxymuconolactone decarboxylase family protein n=1 Tax=Rhodococcus sp. 114MFTsu3.1 TaxID=1172184 RepID=UPI003FA7D203
MWLRLDLAPRDRSLAKVSALIATGQVDQITFHLGRAMDNGLTAAQASEALSLWLSTRAGPTCSPPCP